MCEEEEDDDDDDGVCACVLCFDGCVCESHRSRFHRGSVARPRFSPRSSDGSLQWMWVIKVRRWRAGFAEWPPMCKSQELLLLQ